MGGVTDAERQMTQKLQLQRGWPAKGVGIRSIVIDDACKISYCETPPYVADVHQWIDNYAAGGVDVVGWDVMFGEITWFDSQVGEAPAADNWCGALIAAGKDPEQYIRPATNFAHMKREGIDLPAVVGARLHEHGIRFFPAVRMVFAKCSSRLSRSLQNDPSAFICYDPDILAAGAWSCRFNLNYAHPKVYAHRLAIIREIIERYDLDGIYLSFRGVEPPPFANIPGVGLCVPFEKTVEVMNRFIQDVRGLLDAKAGACGIKRLGLAVGVAHTLELNHEVGLDVPTWLAEGWVDAVSVKHEDGLDPGIPVEEFLSLPGADGCAFYPGFSPVNFRYVPLSSRGRPAAALEHGTDLVRLGDWYPAMAHFRSAAHNFYTAGAAGYLGMNFMYSMSETNDWWFRHLHDPQQVAKAPHHYLYYADPNAAPFRPLQVPITTERHTFRLRIGDDLSKRSPARILLGAVNLADAADFVADINGHRLELTSETLDRSYFTSGAQDWGNWPQYVIKGDGHGHLFIGELPASAMKRGDNELAVRLGPDASASPDAVLRWVEVVVP